MRPGGRGVQLTSLSVGHPQADSGDGRIAHIAVKLQKASVLLPGRPHYWHCGAKSKRARSQ